MYTVLCVDNDVAFSSNIMNMIGREPDFHIIGCARDGEEAINQIAKEKPDIIIMDPTLEKFDGLFIIRQLRQEDAQYNPIFYIVTPFSAQTYLKMLDQLKVDFISIKPVQPEVITQNLLQLTVDRREEPDYSPAIPTVPAILSPHPVATGKDLMSVIKGTLESLGIPANNISSRRTLEAVYLCLQDDKYLYKFNNNLYVDIASKYNITKHAIERSIRSCIQKMVEQKTPLFHTLFDQVNPPITNTLFIHKVVDYLEQGQ